MGDIDFLIAKKGSPVHSNKKASIPPRAKPGSKRVTRVSGAGCHSVGVAAAGWLESGSECRCVRRAEIEEAPDDGKWGPLVLPMFCQ